ncbi:trans-aconitate 2-methyltransferase [Amycolatopsis sp.]|jgi:SAM-dependent methyltransferase|uniref:class I SAM-dependent methyltransferase n=1 Tax=Amycolatopsis sp. TaxID=37632 RepID=UPI0026094AB1|nr:class I SAM-dependent methyltransferase [Amycolatopsis sp.]
MPAHTHDEVDWAARLPAMLRGDALDAETFAGVASRLTSELPDTATVVDVGCGTGGMSAALAAELGRRGGGTLILVDATEVLLEQALESATKAAAGAPVRVSTVVADIAGGLPSDVVPPADLIWASAVVHHLPDQQAGVAALAATLGDGGVLALAEGPRQSQCLPWELGIGEPGLERRLLAARDEWFCELRAGMAGVVAMPYGWNVALRRAGLVDVTSFSYLFDHPAPASAAVLAAALDQLAWISRAGAERVGEADQETVHRLTDPADPAFLGNREDVFLFATGTVYWGRSR